jgi:hypothetical protein
MARVIEGRTIYSSDPDETGWTIHQYIHLNPVRVRRFGASRSDEQGPNTEQTNRDVKELTEFRVEFLPLVCRILRGSEMAVHETVMSWVPARTFAAARSYGFSSVRALALPVVLVFSFAHGCFDDPLYPWIANTLDDRTIADPEARASRSEKKAMIWLDHVLTYFGEGARA